MVRLVLSLRATQMKHTCLTILHVFYRKTSMDQQTSCSNDGNLYIILMLSISPTETNNSFTHTQNYTCQLSEESHLFTQTDSLYFLTDMLAPRPQIACRNYGPACHQGVQCLQRTYCRRIRAKKKTVLYFQKCGERLKK